MNFSFKKLPSFLSLITFLVTTFYFASLKAEQPSTDQGNPITALTPVASTPEVPNNQSPISEENKTTTSSEQGTQYHSYFSIIQDLFFYEESVDLYHSKSPKNHQKTDNIAKFHEALKTFGSTDQNIEAVTNLESLITLCNLALTECILDNNSIDDLLTTSSDQNYLPSNSTSLYKKMGEIAANFTLLQSTKPSFDAHQQIYAEAKKHLFSKAVEYDLAYQAK